MIRGSDPLVIEASEAWPVGRHPVGYLSDNTPVYVRSFMSINALEVPSAFPPEPFSPKGDTDRGSVEFLPGFAVGMDEDETEQTVPGVMVERMGGARFMRLWLDIIRAAFPTARWTVKLIRLKYGVDAAAAYACLDGRVVGAVASVWHDT